MPNSLLLVVLALMLASPAMGQSPAATPDLEPGPGQPQAEASGKSSPRSARRADESPRRFVPTEKISPDSVISFPSDI